MTFVSEDKASQFIGGWIIGQASGADGLLATVAEATHQGKKLNGAWCQSASRRCFSR